MLDQLIYELNTPKSRQNRDRQEITDLHNKYGNGVVKLLRMRANDPRLGLRDRKHWRRISSAVKYFGLETAALQSFSDSQSI